MSRTYEILEQHHDWGYAIASGTMFCKGCDWSLELTPTQPSAVEFRQHQADMIDSEARAQGWVEYAAGSAEPIRIMPAPGHQHETWQIRRGANGQRYCAACGADV